MSDAGDAMDAVTFANAGTDADDSRAFRQRIAAMSGGGNAFFDFGELERAVYRVAAAAADGVEALFVWYVQEAVTHANNSPTACPTRVGDRLAVRVRVVQDLVTEAHTLATEFCGHFERGGDVVAVRRCLKYDDPKRAGHLPCRATDFAAQAADGGESPCVLHTSRTTAAGSMPLWVALARACPPRTACEHKGACARSCSGACQRFVMYRAAFDLLTAGAAGTGRRKLPACVMRAITHFARSQQVVGYRKRQGRDSDDDDDDDGGAVAEEPERKRQRRHE